MLQINNINFSYGEAQVLKNVSLQVKEGSITTLMGSNGAGKTTLMKLISGLLKPISGSIQFKDQDLTKLEPYEICKLGLLHVPEGRKIFPNMTVKENLEVGAFNSKRKEKMELMNEIFEIYPILRKRKSQKAGTLSGGEQQQLAIARSLMGKPELLLLDEPTLGLSPLLAGEVLETINHLARTEKITILLVSQEVEDALEITDYGYILNNGEIFAQGTREELLENEEISNAYLGVS